MEFSHLGVAAKTTAAQLAFLLGPALLLCLAMQWLAHAVRGHLGTRVDAYLTGWLGTPIHELGHAVMALLFGFRVEAIKLWDPSCRGGSIGYVRIAPGKAGRLRRAVAPFFIGTGPILAGVLAVYAAGRLLLGGQLFAPLEHVRWHSAPTDAETLRAFWLQAGPAALAAARRMLDPEMVGSWRLWAFLYAALCIGSHTTLSRADLQHAAPGVLLMGVLLFAANLALFLAGGDATAVTRDGMPYYALFHLAMLLTLAVNAVVLAACRLLFALGGR